MVSVLVVIGILAAVAVPSLSSLQNSRSGMAGKHLMRDLTFARQHAIATGTRTWIVFDVAAEDWDVMAENPSNPGRANAAIMTDPATGGPYTVTMDAGSFTGVEVVSAAFDGDVEVGFDWLGEPLNAAENALAATGTVTLTDGHSVEVLVTGLSRHVSP